MCTALALVIGAGSSLSLALPDIAMDTGATQTQLTWVINAYALVFAALLLPVGIAADRYGRRPALLIGLALHAIGSRVQDFASRAKLVVLFAVAVTLYFTVGQPVFNYYMPWGYFIYLALSQLLGLVAGGLVLVRWFMPNAVTVPSETLH